MTKRAAMTFAGLVVAALLAGAAAFAGWVGGPSAASGTVTGDPVVRRVERTITVHRRARSSGGAVRVVRIPAAGVLPRQGDDPDHRDEGHDDRYEGQDHEDRYEGGVYREEHEDD
jgi:hypothetical protein